MAVDVDQKDISPQASSRRPRFDLVEIDAPAGKLLQRRHEHARRIVAEFEAERSLVDARSLVVVFGEHDEASHVVWVIFDVPLQYLDLVNVGVSLASDSRGQGAIALHLLDGRRVAQRRHETGVREVLL